MSTSTQELLTLESFRKDLEPKNLKKIFETYFVEGEDYSTQTLSIVPHNAFIGYFKNSWLALADMHDILESYFQCRQV